MPTDLAIDDGLIDEVRKVSRRRTRKEAVTAALEEYIALRKRPGVIKLFGTIDALICAVALERSWSVFTSDKDFARYTTVVPVSLHVPR